MQDWNIETDIPVMKTKYTLFRRGEMFYIQDTATGTRSCRLTTQAEPRRTSDVNRESGTESANRRRLERIVRLFRGN